MYPFSVKFPKAIRQLKDNGIPPDGMTDVRRVYVALAKILGLDTLVQHPGPSRLCKDALRHYESTGKLPTLPPTLAHGAILAPDPANPVLPPNKPPGCDRLLWHYGIAMKKSDPGYHKQVVAICQREYVRLFGIERANLPHTSARAILSMMRVGAPVSHPEKADAQLRVKRSARAAKKGRAPVVPPRPRSEASRSCGSRYNAAELAYFRSDAFLASWEWAKLRYQVLLKNNGRCEACGAGKADGVRLHVDHIRPRSKFPELAMDIDNLQCLCPTCNKGKSNWDYTDWRTKSDARDADADDSIPWERLEAF